MNTVNIFRSRLTVVADNSTPGSSGRLCLQLPEEMAGYVGQRMKTVGSFGKDGAVMFIVSGEGLKVTANHQIWFKNGVRDHNVRENWKNVVYILEQNLFVVTMYVKMDTPVPDLPPVQETLF